jgi:hypothetical protein
MVSFQAAGFGVNGIYTSGSIFRVGWLLLILLLSVYLKFKWFEYGVRRSSAVDF